MDPSLHRWIEQFHQTPCRCVLALTGGGSAAAAQLLQVPGGSRTLLEVVIPYHDQALTEFLGRRPAQACSAATSEAMARRAYDRARGLAPGELIVGLGGAASLVSERPKRGEHRCHVSVMIREVCRTWSLTLTKGARNRPGEEALVAAVVLHALGAALRLPPPPPLPLLEDERLEEAAVPADPLARFLDDERPLYIAPDGRLCSALVWDRGNPIALLPGAFNPIHAGHRAMAVAAHEFLGRPVAFELSVANVDKPELSAEEVRRRLTQFVWRAPVWLSHAPMFVQKAKLFPGATFVVGADTALRIVSPRYYDNDPARMLGALDLIGQQGGRFLVACRAGGPSGCLTLADIPVPADYRGLFVDLPPERFRLDVSSTALRAEGFGP